MMDLSGQRFGRLIALRFVGRDKYKNVRWRCVCDCGKKKTINFGSLRSGRSRSCGCLNGENGKTHGLSGTRAYRSWTGMFQRCYSPKSDDWKNYGGRGIYVVKRWHRFENFYADMGERPKGLSIDRRNNDGPYSPKNCRWATPSEQIRNQRRPKRLKSLK